MAIIYQKALPAELVEVTNSPADVALENVDVKESVVESDIPCVDHDVRDEQDLSEDTASNLANDLQETTDLAQDAQKNPVQDQPTKTSFNNKKKKR